MVIYVPMKRIVLTGGPGAGKTVISRRLAKDDPDRLLVVAEAASAIYASMAARWDRLNLDGRRDVQRKIYHLQLDQERRLSAEHQRRTLICDRGTVDGAAYWPDGPEAYWRDLNTTIATELARYELVIWLETSAILGEYDGSASNPVRFEDAPAAVAIGRDLAKLWEAHPRFYRVSAYPNLESKVDAVKAVLAEAGVGGS